MHGFKLLPRRKNRISLETIDFQKDNFGNEIEAILAEIRTGITNKEFNSNKAIFESKLVKQLDSLINKRTGLKVKFEPSFNCPGAILVMPINDHSILLPEDFRGHDLIRKTKEAIDTKNNEVGYIDLKKAKVSGIFSKYTHSIYMDFYFNMTTIGLSPGEVAAIVLHEVGHAFSWYEYSNRLESTNQVMQNVLEELGKKDKNLEYVYRELEDGLSMSKEEIDSLLASESSVIFGYKFFTAVTNKVVSQLPNDKYDETSSEQLADQFCNRFGYGRELVSGLAKINKEHGGEMSSAAEYGSFLKTVFLTMLIASFFSALFSSGGLIAAILSTVIIPTSMVVGVILNPAALLFTLAYMFIILILTKVTIRVISNNHHTSYDELVDRYKRIRSDMISLLKNVALTDKDRDTVIFSIDSIDKMIEYGKEHKNTIIKISESIADVFNYKDKADIKIQQLLEELAANDLFLKSAKLKSVIA